MLCGKGEQKSLLLTSWGWTAYAWRSTKIPGCSTKWAVAALLPKTHNRGLLVLRESWGGSDGQASRHSRDRHHGHGDDAQPLARRVRGGGVRHCRAGDGAAGPGRGNCRHVAPRHRRKG